MAFACVLISDITGSTQLYETEKATTALAHISAVLARMREIIEGLGGYCVKSQGDDVLSYFRGSEQAFQAAWTMINEDWPGSLSVHVGMYVGDIMSKDNDIYGRPVNTAARLSSLAKPGEILLGDECFEMLNPETKERLAMIGELQLKGMSEPTRVYSCSVQETAEQTVMFNSATTSRGSRTESAMFTYRGKVWQISEGETLSIGRSDENDIVLDHAWVSRKHANVAVRRWQLEYTDHSSSGSILQTPDGQKLAVHRRATLLNGSGLIFFGPDNSEEASSPVSYVVVDMAIQTA